MKNRITKLLKTINYPGYSRDIVSFGIIHDIIINNAEIIIHLKLDNDNSPIEEISNQIKHKISSELIDYEIKIKIIHSSSQVSSKIHNIKSIKNIIAIASGKGGVGKSTTTINIASILSEKFKVGILDLDIYGPSLPMALNCYEKPKMNLKKQLIPIEKYGMKLMSFGFLNSEKNPTIWRGPMVSRMTQQFFEHVDWGELDYLLLDLPPGTGDIQLTLVQQIALSGAIIVTTPQDLAILDVTKASDMFRKLKTPIIGVIENMSGILFSGSVYDEHGNKVNGSIKLINDTHLIKNGKFSIEMKLFKGSGGRNESKRLDVPFLARIPMDANLSISTDKGFPFVQEYKDSDIRKCFDVISKKIIDF